MTMLNADHIMVHVQFWLLLSFWKTKKTFHNCTVPMGFFLWEIQVAFPGESQLWQNCATQPTVHAGRFSVSISHQTLTWTTGSLTCALMLMHVIAQEGVQTQVREPALKVDSGKAVAKARSATAYPPPQDDHTGTCHPRHLSALILLYLQYAFLNVINVKFQPWPIVTWLLINILQVGLSERKLYILQPLHTGHMLTDRQTHTHTQRKENMVYQCLLRQTVLFYYYYFL